MTTEKLWLKLGPEHKDWVAQRAQEAGMTMAQFIRDLIDDDIANEHVQDPLMEARIESYRHDRRFRGRPRDNGR